jgi:hypothetical protein
MTFKHFQLSFEKTPSYSYLFATVVVIVASVSNRDVQNLSQDLHSLALLLIYIIIEYLHPNYLQFLLPPTCSFSRAQIMGNKPNPLRSLNAIRQPRSQHP